MNDATVEEIAIAKPAVTRMWISLQKLSRLRDHFSRDKTAEGRLTAANAMMDLADEVRMLAAEVLAEAERTAGPIEPGTA